MSPDERLLRLENAFTTLVELSRNMDERMVHQDSRTNGLDGDLRALTALVSESARNQRRTEEDLREQVVEFRADLSVLSDIVGESARNQRRTEEELREQAIEFRADLSALRDIVFEVTKNQMKTEEELRALKDIVSDIARTQGRIE